jgi:alanine racemase
MDARVVAEIDLGAIRQNVGAIRSLVGLRVEVMPVVKADGYGHGAVEVARAALEGGAEWLGVATPAEGIALRKAFPGASICVLSPFARDEAEEIAYHQLVPFVGDLESARALSLSAHRIRSGVCIHMKVDTGMGRSGVLPEEAARLAEYIARMPAITITGLATHFACAESDPDFTSQQLALFHQARKAVEAADAPLRHYHAAASAALLSCPSSRLNLVRPGLLVYGIRPEVPADMPVPPFHPALTLKTRIVLIRTLPAGHTLSYGRTYSLARPSRIAVLPVGYGDGYPRDLSHKGSVLVCGRRVPIVGRICMDVTLADVTDIPDASVGTEAVLIGAQDEERIRVEEIARLIGTTEHDVTTRLTSRVPRVYAHGKP